VNIEWNSIFGLQSHFAHFSRKSNRAPLYLCIQEVQQKCV
jgi:hypothetical protein